MKGKERRMKGYFKIARHYKWALSQVFEVYGYNYAVIVEGERYACIYMYNSNRVNTLSTDVSSDLTGGVVLHFVFMFSNYGKVELFSLT